MKGRISLGEAEERGMMIQYMPSTWLTYMQMPIYDMRNDVHPTLVCIGLRIFMDITTPMRSAKCTMQMMTS
jgi:hypothetical protein